MYKFCILLLLVGLFNLNIYTQNKQNVSNKSQSKNTQKKSNPPKEEYVQISEGRGINGINVGRSTMNDVIKKFGKDYKWVVNKKYSFQMTYPKHGVSFYMCQSDKKKEIFLIEMKRPFKAKTTRGIILGKSTLEDIHKHYGKKKTGLEYRGISFYYNRIGGKNLVTVIDVTENSGIRQCKDAK